MTPTERIEGMYQRAMNLRDSRNLRNADAFEPIEDEYTRQYIRGI
jgi:hypothetical protein